MDLLQPLAAIVLVMALLGGALFLLRKRGAASFHLPGQAGAGGVRHLEVIERVTLGQQHTLHLVRVGERRVLVATGPGSCRITETI